MSAFSWSVQELPHGLKVASGTAPTLNEAKREAGHYAVQYAQDSTVAYQIKEGRKVVLKVSIDLSVGRIAAEIKS